MKKVKEKFFKPLTGFVVVKQLEIPEEVMENGIIVPGNHTEDANRGTVIAVDDHTILGSGLGFGVGDVVMFKPYAVNPIKFHNVVYLIIPVEDILAVVEG